MRRAIAIAGLLLAAAGLTGCSGNEPPGREPPPVLPTRTSRPVAVLSHVGGFVSPAFLLLRAPMLAVYADGRAIVDTSKVLALGPAEVAELVATMRRELGAAPPTLQPGRNPQYVDAPSTQLDVLTADGGTRSVLVNAPFEAADFPRELQQSSRALLELRDRARRDGQPYTADRVRLAIEPREDVDPGHPPQPWPPAVPVPAKDVLDLDGAAARAVARMSPVDGVSAAWVTLRLPDGRVVGASWRYLLPHE